MGPESEILRNFPEFRPDFPTKQRTILVWFGSITIPLFPISCPLMLPKTSSRQYLNRAKSRQVYCTSLQGRIWGLRQQRPGSWKCSRIRCAASSQQWSQDWLLPDDRVGVWQVIFPSRIHQYWEDLPWDLHAFLPNGLVLQPAIVKDEHGVDQFRGWASYLWQTPALPWHLSSGRQVFLMEVDQFWSYEDIPLDQEEDPHPNNFQNMSKRHLNAIRWCLNFTGIKRPVIVNKI